MSVYKGDKIIAGGEAAAEYIRKQNVLSNYERVTSRQFTAAYDGEIDGYITGLAYDLQIRINDVNISIIERDGSSGPIIPVHATVKKGDKIVLWNAPETSNYFFYARWYKLRDYTGR